MKTDRSKVFLTAEWRYLAMFNYEVPPELLAPLVPRGTELDSWQGKVYVSLVGFLFQKTRVRGISIPFHRNFEEVNLRFYVRREADDGWRRGVVFIKELVPRAAIAFIARKVYNENYLALPMSHALGKTGEQVRSVAYAWRFRGAENHMTLSVRGDALPLVNGSEQEFITEHYWGYAAQRDGSTMEYRVEHPRWRVWESSSAQLHCDIARLYGEKYAGPLARPPLSVFLADGSEVKVYQGVKV